MSHTSPALCFLVQPIPITLLGISYDQLTKEDEIERGLHLVLCHMPALLKVHSWSTTAPFWDISEGHWWREILPVSRNTLYDSGEIRNAIYVSQIYKIKLKFNIKNINPLHLHLGKMIWDDTQSI